MCSNSGFGVWDGKSSWVLLNPPIFFLPSSHEIMEKAMATHSSVLAWRMPGMGEPGGLPSMGSHRVGHDWSDLAAAADKIKPMCQKCSISLWIFLFLLLLKTCFNLICYSPFCQPSLSISGAKLAKANRQARLSGSQEGDCTPFHRILAVPPRSP